MTIQSNFFNILEEKLQISFLIQALKQKEIDKQNSINFLRKCETFFQFIIITLVFASFSSLMTLDNYQFFILVFSLSILIYLIAAYCRIEVKIPVIFKQYHLSEKNIQKLERDNISYLSDSVNASYILSHLKAMIASLDNSYHKNTFNRHYHDIYNAFIDKKHDMAYEYLKETYNSYVDIIELEERHLKKKQSEDALNGLIDLHLKDNHKMH